MNDRLRCSVAGLLLAALLLTAGCVGTDTALDYVGEAHLSYYKDVSTEIAYPDVASANPPEVANTLEPRTIAAALNRPIEDRKDEIVDITLQEAVHIALANNRIIRSAGSFLSPGNSILANGETTPSVYDSAIQETGVLFGRRGVEGALAEFDTTFSTSMIWQKSEAVQNNVFFAGGLSPGVTLTQDVGTFRSGLTKRFADGGSFLVGHDWDYRGTNAPGQLFPSAYTGNVRAEYRRPMWAGSGTEYTRIAGPINPGFSAIAGVSQGVVIARINNDITLAEFETAVRGLAKDVEDLYWDLYLAYRLYHTAVVARQANLATWERAKNIDEIGGIEGFRKQDEPQAREQYFLSKAEAERALSEVYSAEIRLRRLLGLSVNSPNPPPVAGATLPEYPNGFVLRPKDSPAMSEIVPDWRLSLTSALTERLELRKQKWNIKSLDLQLQAARSLVNPRLDFVSGYQVNGFGDNLLGQNDDDVGGSAQGLDSAYETITQGNQTAWTLGFEFSMPVGFRSARSQLRNIELRLVKARQVLAAQELEISHELAVAFQNLAMHHANLQSNFERVRAAERRTNVLRGQFQEGLRGVTVDIVVRAVADRAQAEADFFRSVSEYNKAIVELEFRKGTLLEYNNIFLAEDEWTPKAYEQALRRAWARSHGFDQHKLLDTEPVEFVPQHRQQHPAGGFIPPGAGSPIAPPPPAPSETVPPGEGVPPEPGEPESTDAPKPDAQKSGAPKSSPAGLEPLGSPLPPDSLNRTAKGDPFELEPK